VVTVTAVPVRIMFLVTEDWYFCSHRLGLALSLAAKGMEVAVACRVDRHGEQIEKAGLRLYPLQWTRRSLNPLHLIASTWRIWRAYRNFRPDITHHVALKPVLLGSLAARLAGVRRVVNAVAGLGFVFSSQSLRARVLKIVMTFAFRLLLDGRRFRTIVQNDDDGRVLESRGIVAHDHLMVIRGAGVDLDRFRPTPEPPGTARAVMVSRMIREKGVSELVEAARMLQARSVPVRIVLAGTPDPENPTAIPEAMLNAWAREGVIDYLGHVDDVPTLWQRSHIAVLPSYYGEGVPLALIEAAAAGRPLIAADGPGLRDITRPGESGLLVPPRDAVALALAIEMLVKDSGLRVHLGAGARRLAETAFGAGAVFEATLAVYRDLLRDP
jgi:glycosyltransferase involved in cell wall biosynthesis